LFALSAFHPPIDDASVGLSKLADTFSLNERRRDSRTVGDLLSVSSQLPMNDVAGPSCEISHEQISSARFETTRLF
jgi:hypothetical protein